MDWVSAQAPRWLQLTDLFSAGATDKTTKGRASFAVGDLPRSYRDLSWAVTPQTLTDARHTCLSTALLAWARMWSVPGRFRLRVATSKLSVFAGT
jgi:hypothetical protein